MEEFKRKYVYFEKQQNDRLCGVHCLNSLLQSPLFDPILLSSIAQTLDDLERELYKEDLEISDNHPKLIGNVDDDGNYNIQVLSEALKTYDIEIIPLKKSEAEKILMNEMDKLEAFIFNSSTHWFAIRKIDNVWFNLNSTNPGPGPQIISDFYLSAFIKGTEELGYTNFMIKNLPVLPNIDDEIFKNLNYYQKLVSIDDIIKYKPKKINMGDSDESALEKAIEMSKKEYEKSNQNDFYYPTDYINYNEQVYIEDDEMRIVMEESLNEYIKQLNESLPSEPENGLYLKIKVGNKEYTRKFNAGDKIEDIKKFIKINLRTYNNVKLLGMLNNKIYIDDDKTLNEENINNNDVFIAQI